MKIAIYNNKGGVGKTSLTAHVGFRAMETKQSITVVDADKQSNAMDWLTGGDWDGNSTVEVGSLTITKDIRDIEADALVVIDCPPSFEVVQNYPDVDVWIIPVNGRFSVIGSMTVIDEIKAINPKARIVIIANMVDVSTKFGKAQLDEIKKIGVELYKLIIPRHDIVGKAEIATQSAWSIPYGSRSLAAQNLKLFAEWVLNGCKVRGVYNGD